MGRPHRRRNGHTGLRGTGGPAGGSEGWIGYRACFRAGGGEGQRVRILRHSRHPAPSRAPRTRQGSCDGRAAPSPLAVDVQSVLCCAVCCAVCFAVLGRAARCCSELCCVVLCCAMACAALCCVLCCDSAERAQAVVLTCFMARTSEAGSTGLRCVLFLGQQGGRERGLVRVVGWFLGRMGGARGGWIGSWSCFRAGRAEGGGVGILHQAKHSAPGRASRTWQG